MVRKVLYTAAHSGFNLGQVPLGGGASICQHLIQEWSRQKPFDWEVLGPSILKESAPANKDLVQYSEMEYARFCRRFERALTEKILQFDPKDVIVLCNDVSEGPDFKTLTAKGYTLYTIYHVDVVDYFTAVYLHSWIRPETTTSLYRWICRFGLSGVVPGVLKLIWQKQEDSVRYSKGLIVPSRRMKEVLLRCSPELPVSNIHVLPWGIWPAEEASVSDILKETETLKQSFPDMSTSWALLCLSRISPEKGQDRLLKALASWEKQTDYPKEGITLFIAGEAAYMMGEKYLLELQRIAKTLKRTKVHFVGYAAGTRKKALFNNSDIYVFPSKHESYGLTLLEALREGKPVLTTASHGAQEVFKPEFGEMVPPGPENDIPDRLIVGLKRLMSDRLELKRKGDAVAAWAKEQRFSDTAAKLADLLVHGGGRRDGGPS